MAFKASSCMQLKEKHIYISNGTNAPGAEPVGSGYSREVKNTHFCCKAVLNLVSVVQAGFCSMCKCVSVSAATKIFWNHTDLNVSLEPSIRPYPWKIAGCFVLDMNIKSIL